MALSISAIKTAYNLFLTQKSNVATLTATLTALGARPIMPTIASADADYNSVITAQATYDAAYATASSALFTGNQLLRTKEIDVITAIGYGSNQAQGDNGQDQWIELTNSGGGVLTYHDWIGYGSTSLYLKIQRDIAPTKAFPNI